MTFDILDANIAQALDSARALSSNNEHLWALALVEDDSQGARGLIWLTGMDYNDGPAPGSTRKRRSRREMQDRYLAAKHARGDAPVLPDGLRVIRVFPEWVSGWPLWENFTDDYRLTGESLGLSRALSDALFEWNERWLQRDENDPVPDGWLDQGRTLVTQLQTELTGIAEVSADFLSGS